MLNKIFIYITRKLILLIDNYILCFSCAKNFEKFSAYFVRSNLTNSYNNNNQNKQIQCLAFSWNKYHFFSKKIKLFLKLKKN